jgi:hypothetical protein
MGSLQVLPHWVHPCRTTTPLQRSATRMPLILATGKPHACTALHAVVLKLGSLVDATSILAAGLLSPALKERGAIKDYWRVGVGP